MNPIGCLVETLSIDRRSWLWTGVCCSTDRSSPSHQQGSPPAILQQRVEYSTWLFSSRERLFGLLPRTRYVGNIRLLPGWSRREEFTSRRTISGFYIVVIIKLLDTGLLYYIGIVLFDRRLYHYFLTSVTLPFTVRLLHSNYCVTTVYLRSNYNRKYMYLRLVTRSYKRNYRSVTTV